MRESPAPAPASASAPAPAAGTAQADPAQLGEPAKTSSKAPTAVGKAPIAPDDPEPGAGSGVPLPFEHDESIGNVAAAPDPVIAQAAKDIAAGQVDTDLRSSGGQTHARREDLLKRER